MLFIFSIKIWVKIFVPGLLIASVLIGTIAIFVIKDKATSNKNDKRKNNLPSNECNEWRQTGGILKTTTTIQLVF